MPKRKKHRRKQINKQWNQALRIAERYVFPVLLLLYPLVAAGQGIDVSDPTYSLTNFRFFPELSGSWAIATWLANVVGFVMMKLPGGGTLLGMNLYTGLAVSAMALLSYFFLKGKMPAWMAFAGEVIAISFCWCPTTILYNYLTYFFFLCGCILLYRGLIWDRKGLLIAAGVCLGLNVMVRMPNIAEAILILAVFYYGQISGKEWKESWRSTGYCVVGFLVGFLVCFLAICIQYGPAVYFEMFGSLAGYSATDESYSPFSMITSILLAYGSTLKWVMLLAVCVIAGWLFFRMLPKKMRKAGRILYVCCIPVLIRLFWGRGMFTFTYYNYRSIYEWGMLLLYLVLIACALVLTDSRMFRRDRLLALIVLLEVSVTPIGSNNGTMPALNNLFLAAPFALWGLWQFWPRIRRKAFGFPAAAIICTILIMVTVQGIGFKSSFAFGDGIYGEKRDAKVENSDILKGMETRAENADALTGLVDFLGIYGATDSLITFGNAPGLHFMLDQGLAISHGWPDLDTYPVTQWREELSALSQALTAPGSTLERPMVILYKEKDGITEYGMVMEYELAEDDDRQSDFAELREELVDQGVVLDAGFPDVLREKMTALQVFLTESNYTIIYENEKYQVLQ